MGCNDTQRNPDAPLKEYEGDDQDPFQFCGKKQPLGVFIQEVRHKVPRESPEQSALRCLSLQECRRGAQPGSLTLAPPPIRSQGSLRGGCASGSLGAGGRRRACGSASSGLAAQLQGLNFPPGPCWAAAMLQVLARQ